MNKLIIAAVLVFATNTASAAAFSPWTDTSIEPTTVVSERAEVANLGFAPWREREVAAGAIEIKATRDVAVRRGDENVFRPWS